MPTGTAPRTYATTVTSSATISAGRHTPVDTSAGAVTVTLPTPVNSGAYLSIEKVDASINTVTVSGNIRGATTTINLGWQYESVELHWTGTTWRPINGHKTRASLDATYTPVVQLPASNGSDDTATLNTILGTAAGKLVRGRPGTTYLTSAPLVLPPGGNVTLDMTGCTITQIPGGVDANLLNNASVTPLRTTADAAMTASSTTLTSASAAFTAADVGRWVKIAGAAVSGDLLVARILSVTNATTAVLDTAATTAVTGATLNVHNNDVNITIIGGRWDHGRDWRAWVQDVRDHAVMVRFATGLRFLHMTHTSAHGKYSISLAGVQDVVCDDHYFDTTNSDGIHVAGPAKGVVARNLSGITNDDMFAITAAEPSGWLGYSDSLGLVSDVVVDGVRKTSGLARCVIIVNGRSASVSNVTIRNVSGGPQYQAVILAPDKSLPGGSIDDVIIDGVHATSDSDYNMVEVDTVTSRRLEFRNIGKDQPGSHSSLIHINDSTIRSLVIDGARHILSGSGTIEPITFRGANSIDHATLRGLDVQVTDNSGHDVITVADSSTIGVLKLADSEFFFNGGGCNVLKLFSGRMNLIVSNTRAKNIVATGSFVQSTGDFLPNLSMSGVVLDTLYWIGDLAGGTLAQLSNFRGVNNSGTFAVESPANIIVSGAGIDLTAWTIGIASGGRITARSFDFFCDISVLNNAAAGDRAYNANGALSCGFGPVIYTGTAWKNLVTGATY